MACDGDGGHDGDDDANGGKLFNARIFQLVNVVVLCLGCNSVLVGGSMIIGWRCLVRVYSMSGCG